MIIPDTPGFTRIVRDVWRPLTILFVWDVVVTAVFYFQPFKAPPLPLSLFGTALALFLGVRDNAAYQRWWEGRGLWGLMTNASRSLARGAFAMIDNESPEARALKRGIVFGQIAYVHAVRCRLRRQDPTAEVTKFAGAGDAAEVLRRQNVPNALLDLIAGKINDARRLGCLDTIQQVQLEAILVDCANAQGGMERVKNTPLPSQYRFFPQLFVRLFCILLPIGLVETLGIATPVGSTIAGLMFLAVLQIGDDLVDPFANRAHDVPLTSICRTIEIDLLEAIGEPSPRPLEAVDGVLW